MTDFPLTPHEKKHALRAERYRDELAARRKIVVAEGLSEEADLVDFVCVVANERSKRYYLPSHKSYRRALRQKKIILFDGEELAIAEGFVRAPS